MNEITKDKFYSFINPKNVSGRIVNNKWPYETHFYVQSQPSHIIAKTVGYLEGVFEKCRYYTE